MLSNTFNNEISVFSFKYSEQKYDSQSISKYKANSPFKWNIYIYILIKILMNVRLESVTVIQMPIVKIKLVRMNVIVRLDIKEMERHVQVTDIL